MQLFADSDFSLANAEQYTLLCKLSAIEFSCCIIDENANVQALYAFKLQSSDYLSELKKIAQENDWLYKTSFKEIKTMLIGKSFSLIPTQIFQTDLLAEYQKLLFELHPQEALGFNTHPTLGFVDVFAANIEEALALKAIFPIKFEVFHQSSALIEGFTGNFQLVNTDLDMLVQIEKEFVIVLVKRKKQLIFCNAYPIKADTDIAYFVLLVMKELGMNTNTDVVSVYGDIHSESSVYKTLYKYIRYIYFGEKPAFLSFSNLFDSAVPSYKFFDLFGLYLCKNNA